MSTYIQNRILEGEHQQQDFKFQVNDSRKIARSLVAFANTNGGRLLIGVKDNGVIAGVSKDEEYHMIEAAAQLYCKPEILFESKSHSVEGKTVLEIIVRPIELKPCYALDENNKWLAFIRVKDQNILASSVLVRYWKRLQKPGGTIIRYSEKEKLLLSYLQQNEHISISKFCKISGLKRFPAETILVNLMSAKVIKIVQTEKQTFYTLRS